MVRTSMKSLKAIPVILAATLVTAAAAPRFALVRVKDIYTSLPSTSLLQEQIKKERGEIMKDQRADELRKIISELQALQAQLSDKNNPLDEETNRKLARTYEIKRQEAQTLQQEFESFKTEQEKAINKRMVAGMRASLDRIATTSGKIAKERGFDAIFDSSGNTNTGVPFVLFSKSSPDLTPDVQAVLMQTEPAAPPPAAAPQPAAAQPPVDTGAGHFD